MPEPKKKPTSQNTKMRIIYLAFITLLLIIIIFATSLLMSRKNNSDIVKGESLIHTETSTVSDITETSSEISATVKVQTSLSSATVSPTSDTATSTVVSVTSALQSSTATTNPPQNTSSRPATVKVGIASPRPAVSPTRPAEEPNNIPETTSVSTESNITVPSIKLTFYECNMEVGDEPKMPIVTMPDTAESTEEKWESSDESVAVVDWQGNITAVGNGICTIKVSSVTNPEIYAEIKVTVGAVTGTSDSDPESTQTTTQTIAPEVDEPTYIDGILIANKTYALPEDYNPGLDSETESAFNTLSEAASEEGLDIWLASGFRSYETQDRIYNNYVDSYGQETADTFSARAGHSEHQTGLAIDVNTIDDSFAGTPEAIWLADHAHEYGFIIRYPKGKEDITGYKYEPWHIRYLGVEKATEVYNSGLTLEEFLGIDSVYQN